jgi:phosphatidylserine/phosphatidylglycerophosphate/cardiolipin synthase-like enzyme
VHAILEGIRGAKRTILVRAHQRRVQVHALLDVHAQPHHPPVPAVERLVAAGITVFLDARHTWAHDKVMVPDAEVVITGSYNWTVAAEQENGENLLVIHDPQLAQVYTENWQRHAHHSIPYRPTVPWWARIRVVWIYLRRGRPKQWDRDMGDDG